MLAEPGESTKPPFPGPEEAFPDLFLRVVSSHPFLRGCANGTVMDEQFNVWLAQDFHFVRAFKVFVESCLARAPKTHQKTIAAAVSALDEELVWFDAKARERRIAVESTPVLPTTKTYITFLEKLQGLDVTYAAQVTALYAIELIYMEAWGRVKDAGAGGGKYREFAERWSTPDFAQYVQCLRLMAVEAYGTAPTGDAASIADTLEEVLELEDQFWDMAMGILPTTPTT